MFCIQFWCVAGFSTTPRNSQMLAGCPTVELKKNTSGTINHIDRRWPQIAQVKSSSLHDYTPPFLGLYPSPHPFPDSRHKQRLTSVLLSEWKSLSHVWLFATPWTTQSWNSPGQNTGVGSLSLLQGIFPIQELNRVFCIAGEFFTKW